MAYPVASLLMMLLMVLVMLLVVSAVVMLAFNASMGYLSTAFSFPFTKQMGILEALALVVLLWVVGGLLFKSMETVVVSCVPKEDKTA